MRKLSKRPLNLRPMFAIACAILLFWGSLLAFGGLLQGYAHAVHPVALLGAQGTGRAMGFNVLGFLLPGLILAATAWCWRHAMGEGGAWSARILAWLALLSALAFATQGLLPLDPRDLDGMDSRLHAAAWTVWWVAFMPAALLTGHGMRRLPPSRGLIMASVTMAVLVFWLAVSPPPWMMPGIAQRLMLGLWFGWWLVFARRMTE